MTADELDVKKKSAKYITAIDPIELAVRMLEAGAQMTRPVGSTAHQAFFALENEDQDRWLRVANAAMEFWKERIQDLRRTN